VSLNSTRLTDNGKIETLVTPIHVGRLRVQGKRCATVLAGRFVFDPLTILHQ
jgi:hypothetical protein